MLKSKNSLTSVAVLSCLLFLMAGCSGTHKKITFQPGEQISEAQINLEEGSVTQEMENIVVKVRGANLPSHDRNIPHPTFWVTIENKRDSKIIVKPAQARLIDSSGNQHKPLPMTLETSNGEDSDYAIFEPQIRLFVFQRYGWGYYPFYPYRSFYFRGYPYWSFAGFGRYGRFYGSPLYYDPFWDYYQPNWVQRVKTVESIGNKPEQQEVIYPSAKLTYVVVFPDVKEAVTRLRLIVPEISFWDENDTEYLIDFELIFAQKAEMAKK